MELKQVPIQTEEVFGASGAWTSGGYREVVPTGGRGQQSFTPYREFRVYGDKQREVVVRIEGFENSPEIKGLKKVEFSGLHLVERMVTVRGVSRPEVQLVARKMTVVN